MVWGSSPPLSAHSKSETPTDCSKTYSTFKSHRSLIVIAMVEDRQLASMRTHGFLDVTLIHRSTNITSS